LQLQHSSLIKTVKKEDKLNSFLKCLSQ